MTKATEMKKKQEWLDRMDDIEDQVESLIIQFEKMLFCAGTQVSELRQHLMVKMSEARHRSAKNAGMELDGDA